MYGMPVLIMAMVNNNTVVMYPCMTMAAITDPAMIIMVMFMRFPVMVLVIPLDIGVTCGFVPVTPSLRVCRTGGADDEHHRHQRKKLARCFHSHLGLI